jgi:hypothetical protein
MENARIRRRLQIVLAKCGNRELARLSGIEMLGFVVTG